MRIVEFVGLIVCGFLDAIGDVGAAIFEMKWYQPMRGSGLKPAPIKGRG
jgi:hypothetical protein